MSLLLWNIKNKLNDICFEVESAADFVTRKVSNVSDNLSYNMDIISGKTTLYEAERLYDDTMKKYKARIRGYNSLYEYKSKEINTYIESINDDKKKIFNIYLKEYVEKISVIKRYNITSQAVFDEEIYVQAKKIKENFNKDFIDNEYMKLISAVNIPFSLLNFIQRKEWQKALGQAKETKRIVELELSKARAEKMRFLQIAKGLKIVSLYFSAGCSMIDEILKRLDNVLQKLESNNSKEALNKEDILLIKSIDTLIISLVTMAKKEYIDKDSLINVEIKEVQDKYNELVKLSSDINGEKIVNEG